MRILNLTLTHDNEFSSYLLNTTFRIRIYANTVEDGAIEVTNDAEVYSLDQDNFLELINQPKHTFLAKKEVGIGAVLLPFRLSVTGVGAGPGMFDISAFLGKEEVISRIDIGLKKITEILNEA